ncbi:MAG: penicillin-binding protein 2, partial [Candidatus Hydrogenedentes bacterium]|nr:penicillin-binding protein 2 [Candidatus Hydrogenedentota bacterium]
MSLLNNKEPKRHEGVEVRLQIFAVLLACALGVLGLQLWRLQVVQSLEFQKEAEAQMIRPQRLKSDRGIIYGAGDVILADNRASADIVFVPGDCTPVERLPHVCELLERLIGIDGKAVLDKSEAILGLKKGTNIAVAPFTQLTVKQDVTMIDRVRVEEHSYDLPGVYTVVQPQRRYHFGKTAGQILGYLGEINDTELERMEGYQMGDIIGKSGVERMYEQSLQGKDGFMLVTKYASGRPQLLTDRFGTPYVAKRDSEGHVLTEVGERKEPKPGQPLHLTLDIKLQSFCEQLLQRRREGREDAPAIGEIGAIVMLNADTGAVLALASNPTYDPSVFVTRGRGHERLELLQAPNPNPMRNRCYMEHYPPGSVYKVLMAAAALETGKITRDTTFFCPGYFQIPGRRAHCHQRRGHGTVSIKEALAYSCDVYFYNVGLRLGIDNMAEWSHKLGIGEQTGIDLPGELPGNMPTKEKKAERFKDKPEWDQRWFDGDTINVSIGQGGLTTTPLQNAVLMASIINGGHRVTPYLNADLPPSPSSQLLSDKTVQIIQEAMQ